MIFTETSIPGAYIIDPEPISDHRGLFARVWCQEEFGAHDLETGVAQSSVSFNRTRGTLRGMHYQTAPNEEVKVVRCIRGALYDVMLDLRPDSAGFLQHVGVELTAENRRALYVPKGVAHGFQTLVDETEILYQMCEFYSPAQARGVRWNDPAFGIRWPIEQPIILDRDASYPDFRLEAEV